MSFEIQWLAFNLLDTPGHQDFSEGTYRPLTAVMVLDAANGIEEQTRKLFEVCWRRDVPIITVPNKFDREGRDPYDGSVPTLSILKLPCSHGIFPSHEGSKRTGSGRV